MHKLALWLVLLSAYTAAAQYNFVVPIQSELVNLCGEYVIPTPTFRCYTYINGSVYADCVRNPPSCTCQAQAPPRFQLNPNRPCQYNYGIEQCMPSEVRSYCGYAATSCTKRCDYLGNCYAANECTCEPGFQSSPTYCGYRFEADKCLVPNAVIGEREITNCGVFASAAYYICPNSTYLNYTACQSVCECQPGTGQTPSSLVKCDGIDRPCNSADVQVACGSNYVNCTKRCQYANDAPSVQRLCVVVPNSCVFRPAPVPFTGTRPCDPSQVQALCGPATESCTQTLNVGVVNTTTCMCNSNGFRSSDHACDAWQSWTVAPYGDCLFYCKQGYLNSTRGVSECVYRKFWSPPPPIQGAPAGYDEQAQRVWFVVNNGMLQWDPVALTWRDNMTNVVAVANQYSLSSPWFDLECTCDGIGFANALSYFETQQGSNMVYKDTVPSVLATNPYHGAIAQLITNPNGPPGNFIPYLWRTSPVLGINFTVFISFFPSNLQSDSFYNVRSCAGPQTVTEPSSYVRLNITQVPIPTPATLIQINYVSLTNTYSLVSSSYPSVQYGPCSLVTPGYGPSFKTPMKPTRHDIFGDVSPSQHWLSFESSDDPSKSITWFCTTNQANIATAFEIVANQRADYAAAVAPRPFFLSDLYDAGSGFSQRQCHELGIPAYIQSTPQDFNWPIERWPPAADRLSDYLIYSTAYPTDSRPYGPVSINQVVVATCLCDNGWTGRLCDVNNVCSFTGSNPICPQTGICTWDPQTHDNDVYWYDCAFNNPRILGQHNCPYRNTSCDLVAFDSVARQMCANGEPIYTAGGVICQCDPGWTFVNNDPRQLRCLWPLLCPTSNFEPCGGYGTIDSSGNCVCDAGYRLNPTSNCCESSACNYPSCVPIINNGLAHISGCDTSVVPSVYTCSNATTGGVWTGECCNVFQPYQACPGGAYVSGEPLYTYNAVNNTVRPVVFNSTGTNINPDAAYCQCFNNAITGEFCTQSSCPVINGLVCNGKGTCVNGLCMNPQDTRCDIDTNYFGCGCQFDLSTSCRLTPNSELCQSEGNCLPSRSPNTTYSCSCNFLRTGTACEVSPCGITNCNHGEGGGTCIIEPGPTPTPKCVCNTVNIRTCLTGVGCLWTGDTCEIDVTQTCGYEVRRGDYRLCNLHGYCNTSLALPSQCECRDGWTTNANKCATTPCPVSCGPNGVCELIDGTPQCKCDPLWSGPSCSTNNCPYGMPGRINDLPACVCNNTAYAYNEQCELGAAKCSTLTCNRTNTLLCGQINCAFLTQCQDGANQRCIPGCQLGINECADKGNICNNGTCSCHWSSQLNFQSQTCVSRCAEWPATQQIVPKLVNSQIVFDRCVCQTGLDPSQFCFAPICLNNGTFNPNTSTCSCQPGWIGNRCELPLCGDNGVYVPDTNSCNCTYPYTGDTCHWFAKRSISGGCNFCSVVINKDGVASFSKNALTNSHAL